MLKIPRYHTQDCLLSPTCPAFYIIYKLVNFTIVVFLQNTIKEYSSVYVCGGRMVVGVCGGWMVVCACMITQKEIYLGT